MILFPQLSSLPAAEGRKLAVVIGVNTYRQNSGLPALGHAASDAQRLSGSLRKTGFTVYEMTHEVAKQDGKEAFAPNLEYIRDQINGVLDFPNLGEDDAVIITLHGHGVQFDFEDGQGNKTPRFYFCPADATIQEIKTANQLTERNHLLPLEELYTELGKCSAATKLLIVDACRNDPNEPGVFRNGLASATLPKLAPPPGGTAAFFSCKPNQMAVEDKALGQRVFTHFLVQGLEGQADQPLAGKPADGVITFSELTTYVANNTYSYVFDKHNGLKQSPEMRGEFDLNLPLAKVSLAILGQRAGEMREFTDLKIKFCWCPPGTFTMGSPASEKDRSESEDDTAGEGGQPVSVTLSQGFWLGQSEVTQEQWESVMGANPSFFSATGDGEDKVTGQSTARFPVENVNWYDAVEFCNRLSEKEGLPPYYQLSAMEREDGHLKSATVSLASGGRQPSGKSGYRFPTEAQWEYACRAGTTTPFHFGSVNDGKKANIKGIYPYGTETNGPNLERTSRVGSYSANGWGLFDMHGNVYEWCFDGYAEQLAGGSDKVNSSTVDRRVLRGGSWNYYAGGTRSAYRGNSTPDYRVDDLGFRIVRTQ